MQMLADVMNKITNTQMELTSEICYKHEVHSNGNVVVKEVNKIIIGGSIYCPLCEREKTELELSKREGLKIEQAMSRRKYNVFRKQSALADNNLMEASFTSYEAVEEEEITNKERALKALNAYRDGEVFTTWLTGNPGVGKSHLAMSILRNLNELGERDKSCLFVSVDEMLLKIRDSFNNKESRYTEHYFVDLLTSVDYLVLDDLGAETGATGTEKKATDFTMRVLYAIANGRQNKSTIITSNLSRPSLEKMYDPKLVSRLMKNIYLIKFTNTTDKRIRNIDF